MWPLACVAFTQLRALPGVSPTAFPRMVPQALARNPKGISSSPQMSLLNLLGIIFSTEQMLL